jgi:hypothetical protein
MGGVYLDNNVEEGHVAAADARRWVNTATN